MKRLTYIVFLATCLACQAAPIAKVYRWDSRVEDGPAMALEPTRGETMVLQPRLLSYGLPMDLTDAETVTMLYKATGSTNVYSVAGGVLVATNGQAQVIWTSSNETAASAYTYDVLVSSLTTTVVGSRGSIKFRDGPAAGAQYATNTPIHILDFASAVLLNIDLSPFLRTSDLTGLVAGVTSITNTADILPSGDGTGAQGLSLSAARLASLARADLALTNAGAFDPAGSAAAVTTTSLGAVPTSRTLTVNGAVWGLGSNGVMTIAGGGGNVASVTGAGGLTNTAGTTGAVTIALSAGSVASLARADVSLTNAGEFATAAQGLKADDWQSKSGTVVYTGDARLSDARAPTAHTQAWQTITGTPTTLSGYGITDGAGGASLDSSNHFANAVNLTNLTAAGILTNSAPLNGTNVVDGTISSNKLNAALLGLIGTGGTGGGGASLDSTNYFRNAVNLTNLTAAGIVTNNSDSLTITNKIVASQYWYGTNAYTYHNGTGIVEVIP